MKVAKRLAFGLVLLCATACERRTEGPNVVLITLDTTRADRLGAMGYAPAKTPVLDSLAARGVVFERAYASTPITLPSHTTILTGFDPNRHGVHDNGRFVVPESTETVAERLAAKGYETAAFVSAAVLDSLYGLNQGFQVYEDRTPRSRNPLVLAVPRRPGNEVTDAALSWLAKPRRAPFFVWAHYYDVHEPRRPPAPFNEIDDRYDGAIAYVDSEIGRLLAGVENAAAARETVIVVVADHGESLGEHGEVTHGVVAYDSTLHVPLIVSGPGFAKGTRSTRFVYIADVTPTILAAVGAPAVENADGRALQTVLASANEAEPVSYFETFLPAYGMGWSRIGGVRSGKWKFTAEPEPLELYDVLADPAEETNRAKNEADVIERMRGLYEEKRVPAERMAADVAAISPEARDRLAALGYVSAPQRFPDDQVPDPRHGVLITGWIDRAIAVALEGRVPQAIQALEIFARESAVARPLALQRLAPLYLLVERKEEAIAAYEAVAEVIGTPDSRIDVAEALLAARRPAEALRVLEEVGNGWTNPTAKFHRMRARSLIAVGKFDDAEKAAAVVLARSPFDDTALALTSQARAARDGADAEIARLRDFLKTQPEAAGLVETPNVLARLLHKRGRDTEAVQILEATAVEVPESRALLAEIFAARGNPEKALEIYEGLVADRPAVVRYGRDLVAVYERLGRMNKALETYERMIGMNAKDAGLLVDRGALELRIGKKAEAESDFRKALALDEKLPEANLNLAIVLLGDGRRDEAEKLLIRALEARPDYAKAHFHLARAYREAGDPRAAEHAEKAAASSNTEGVRRVKR